MSKLDKNIKFNNIYKQIIENIPFILFFFIMMVMLSKDFSFFGDDFKYIKIPIDWSYFSYMINRYYTWSSRVLIDFFTILILKFPKFIIVTLLALSYTMIAYYISKLVNYKKDLKQNCIICTLMFSFPFAIERSAGIVSTMLNYIVVVLFRIDFFKSYKIDYKK